MRQLVERYAQRVDGVIADYLNHGGFPDAATVSELRQMEEEMLALVAANPAWGGGLPPLAVCHSMWFNDARRLPGQLVIARLRAAGIDPLADQLRGRTFVLPARVGR